MATHGPPLVATKNGIGLDLESLFRQATREVIISTPVGLRNAGRTWPMWLKPKAIFPTPKRFILYHNMMHRHPVNIGWFTRGTNRPRSVVTRNTGGIQQNHVDMDETEHDGQFLHSACCTCIFNSDMPNCFLAWIRSSLILVITIRELRLVASIFLQSGG